MRIAIFALAALAATGCAGRSTDSESDTSTQPMSAESTKLEISVSIRGSEAPTKFWTLECPSGRGTLPHATAACAKLATMEDPFAPVPKDKACTQIFGGPEEADVTGTFKGKPVNAHFDKGNGCEIARWNNLEFLFPTS